MIFYKIFIIAFISFFFAGCNNNSSRILSARKSPDGFYIAEHNYTDQDGNGSEITIRSNKGKKYSIPLSGPVPDLFLIWKDNTNLQVWVDQLSFVKKTKTIEGQFEVEFKSYFFPLNKEDIYSQKSAVIKQVIVPPEGVTVSYAKSVDERAQCQLLIKIPSTNNYSQAAVKIIAGRVPPKSNEIPAYSISTGFDLEINSNNSPEPTLTSATISNIPSYNRIPDGDRGTSVHGQFLGNNAIELIDKLSNDTISFEFSVNFFKQVLHYQFKTTHIKSKIENFQNCVGYSIHNRSRNSI